MNTRQCEINGADVRSLKDIYRQLDAQLGFPAYFGGNLDALWDVLSTDIAGPFGIVWKDADVSRRVLAADFDRLLAVLKQLEAERDDFTLQVQD